MKRGKPNSGNLRLVLGGVRQSSQGVSRQGKRCRIRLAVTWLQVDNREEDIES
jgi:hypothetical protein